MGISKAMMEHVIYAIYKCLKFRDIVFLNIGVRPHEIPIKRMKKN